MSACASVSLFSGVSSGFYWAYRNSAYFASSLLVVSSSWCAGLRVCACKRAFAFTHERKAPSVGGLRSARHARASRVIPLPWVGVQSGRARLRAYACMCARVPARVCMSVCACM